MKAPLVSVAIANYNSAQFVEAAIDSALRQNLEDLEVIVVDDASTDGGPALLSEIAKKDSRVRVELLSRNLGPGGARNRALELARGEWFAVLDCDDLMHPARLGRLLALAAESGAEIVADDLLVFHDLDLGRSERFLRGARSRAPTWLSAPEFLRETGMFGRTPNLGFLKPVIQLAAWRATGVRYDESLSIGEDHDLLLRLLSLGLRARIDPRPGYFYRKHASSISHRLGAGALERMAAADARFRADLRQPEPALIKALDRRLASIETAHAFTDAVSALKGRRAAEALAAVARRPGAALLFRMPLAAASRRLLGSVRPRFGAPAERLICVVSRQRLVGRTNGSSTYLLNLAESAKRAGFTVRLVQPSPVALGRWPVLKLKPEMKVFDAIAIRGVARAGSLVIAAEPKIYVEAARGVAAKLLDRLGLTSAWLGAKPAPYASSAPWGVEDGLFVARHARGAEVLLADYAWQTEAIPYALTPSCRTAIVMHDLFHQRTASFQERGASDSVAVLTREEEVELLARAQTVLAIQQAEAAEVRRLLPSSEVVVVPMASQVHDRAQPGRADRLLFVGSNTAPNIVGLKWFFESVWPAVRERLPPVELLVAGNIARALPPAPRGVKYLGVVGDLDALYAEAGVVVSPLTTGSGLKIKLVEALAKGKACVATSVTLQGVERELGPVVVREDDPQRFAAAIVGLLSNTSARERLGAKALAAVKASFTPESAHAEFLAWLDPGPPGTVRAKPRSSAAVAGGSPTGGVHLGSEGVTACPN